MTQVYDHSVSIHLAAISYIACDLCGYIEFNVYVDFTINALSHKHFWSKIHITHVFIEGEFATTKKYCKKIQKKKNSAVKTSADKYFYFEFLSFLDSFLFLLSFFSLICCLIISSAEMYKKMK